MQHRSALAMTPYVGTSCNLFIDSSKAYDTSESFLTKVTFERKFSDVAYTLTQVFICESQFSEMERVLFREFSFAYGEL